MFVKQQVLEYAEHKDEMWVLAQAMNLLEQRDVNGAIKVLLARHDHLIMSQRPMLKTYDQREQLQAQGL
jgi:hypothetical protein